MIKHKIYFILHIILRQGEIFSAILAPDHKLPEKYQSLKILQVHLQHRIGCEICLADDDAPKQYLDQKQYENDGVHG